MVIPAAPVTCTARPAGAPARWSRSCVTIVSARPPAEPTLRFTVRSSSTPSELRSIDASSGRELAESTLSTASRSSRGASALVVHVATLSRYARSTSVSPSSRENVSVAELDAAAPGNAFSSASAAWTDGAYPGRKEAWSAAPAEASDGANVTDSTAATTQTMTMRYLSLYARTPIRSNIACLHGRARRPRPADLEEGCAVLGHGIRYEVGSDTSMYRIRSCIRAGGWA